MRPYMNCALLTGIAWDDSTEKESTKWQNYGGLT